MHELVEKVDRHRTIEFLRSIRLFIELHSSPPPMSPPPSTLWPLVMKELLDLHAVIDHPSPRFDPPVEDWSSQLIDLPRPSLSQHRAQRPTPFKFDDHTK
ncbi:hypothetical protein LSAT2_002267 [Lamellibrachia satsuma]|nr:hypothetical protein LSAT2_002267 [Lamellibrachia satsuma]